MTNMYKVSEIKELIRALDRSNLSEVTVKGEGKEQITLKKNSGVQLVDAAEPVTATAPEAQSAAKTVPAAPPVKEETPVKEEASAPKDAAKEDVEHILSPMVGTFYSSPSPDSKPYVEVGAEVKEGEVVCIVEAMKLMNELEAEMNGKIVDILVENGELVEYGQPLFALQSK